MSAKQFDYLRDLSKPKIQKKSQREPLPTEIRIAATLSFLAHGGSVATTSWFFRIRKSTMYNFIPEVCNAIWEVLHPIYLQCPQNRNEWIRIADDFNNIWNFSNCIRASDGKHCRIKAPPNSGSAFHNYKGHFRLVLLAIVDASYRFIWVDIGDYGSKNNAGIWSQTKMSHAVEHNTMSIPKERPLPNTNCPFLFVIIGDGSFPLKTYLLRPFAKNNLQNIEHRVFNYPLSRARRVSKTAFGILVTRWRILQTPIALKLSTAETIVQAITCLHNYIMHTKSCNNQCIQENIIDYENSAGELIARNWRTSIPENGCINPLGRIGANVGAAIAVRQRNTLARYFVSEEGSISWQWQQIQI